MPAHDVAIYAPDAASYYDAAAGAAGGGAERQTVLLARSLARRGLRVAHVVAPVAEPTFAQGAPVTLVQRVVPEGEGVLGLVVKSRDAWQALTLADPAVVLVRGAQGTLGVAGVWARTHRRRLVFAAANESDLTLSRFSGTADPRAWLFRAGLRLTDATVVQSGAQLTLARERFPRLRDLRQVNSFAEPADPAGPGEAFLWVSRLADYKRPLAYADLAEAVPQARFWMIATGVDTSTGDGLLPALRERAARLPNLELLEPRPHAALQTLIGRAVAMVNTSSFEGVPNTWLEGWARGVPALSLSFDPDDRIARNGLGVVAGDDPATFAQAASQLWTSRADRGELGDRVRAYLADAHGTRVADEWAALVEHLAP